MCCAEYGSVICTCGGVYLYGVYVVYSVSRLCDVVCVLWSVVNNLYVYVVCIYVVYVAQNVPMYIVCDVS